MLNHHIVSGDVTCVALMLRVLQPLVVVMMHVSSTSNFQQQLMRGGGSLVSFILFPFSLIVASLRLGFVLHFSGRVFWD